MKKLVSIFFTVIAIIGLTACSMSEQVVVKPTYPHNTSFEDYDGQREIMDNNTVDESFTASLKDFSYHSASKVLVSSQKNINYSPVSLYMTLAFAGSGAEGATKAEIFSALGIDKKDKAYLSTQTGNLFRQLYSDNKVGKLKIANSLWLQKGNEFKSDFIEKAAKNFYASLYNVDFEDHDVAKKMSQWISENTKGTLTPDISFNREQIISILNTIYFRDEWVDRFHEKYTASGIFHLENNEQTQCDFMNMTYEAHRFVEGEGFISSSLNLKNSGSMTFILPDKGVRVDELLTTPEKVSSLFKTENSQNGKVIFQIPKFSFGSELDLMEAVKSLGIKSAFDVDADFTGITNNTAFISSIKQQTHIALDERGIEASAFTKIDYAGAAPPNEKIAEMILDRPFIFGITSSNGTLLFVGVCKDPTVW